MLYYNYTILGTSVAIFTICFVLPCVLFLVSFPTSDSTDHVILRLPVHEERPPETRIVIGVITGSIYHQTRVQWIASSWLNDVNSERAFFYSDKQELINNSTSTINALGFDFIQPHLNRYKNNAYLVSQLKWFAAIRHMFTAGESMEPHADWYLLIDDDTWLFPLHLPFMLQRFNHKNHWFLGQACSKEAYCEGAGFVVSRSVMKALNNNIDTCTYFKNENLSDRMIGRCIQEHLGVPLTQVDEMNSQPPLFYETDAGVRDRPNGIRRPPCTFHYMNAARHRELVAELTDQNYFLSYYHLLRARESA